MSSIQEELEIAFGHQQAGRIQEAEQHYRRILAADPYCVSAWSRWGELAIQTKRHDIAVQCLQAAVRLAPDSAKVQYNLGLSLQHLGRNAEAIAAYKRAIELDPSHVKAYSNLG